LERKFFSVFQREASLYRDVVASISAKAGGYHRLPELLHFIEEKTNQSLGLRRVKILVTSSSVPDATNGHQGSGHHQAELMRELLELSGADDWSPVEKVPALGQLKFDLAYPLRRDEKTTGVMLIDAPADLLSPEVRAVLQVLSTQAAIAIEDCRLVEENSRLERKLAQGERLAALGQMAATVAHEVKNPLSAIKSIAQVMREDEGLSVEYGRDLNLIVGETDRLSRSVTQMLDFARQSPQALAGADIAVAELVHAVADLFRAEAAERGIRLTVRCEITETLDGERAAALRDATSNLIVNAMQASPLEGEIIVQGEADETELRLTIKDGGAGIPLDVQSRIWEPFFTTKQRGTGLGLAIVRKRIEEVGGTTRLIASGNGEGSTFGIYLPIGPAKEK
jgi:signal transduction histidine kinase